MQDPNADTEWNDVLRAKGIIGPKEEISEDDIVGMVESTIQAKAAGKDMGDMNLDELDDIEDELDEEDERAFEEYKRKRMQEMQQAARKNRFGSVLEITKVDYVNEVNKAGEDIWVAVHIYKDGLPICRLMNAHLSRLAVRFPSVKFVRGVADVCIPNYPDRNLPTVFLYRNGELKKQWVGPHEFGGMNVTEQALEWKFAQVGVIQTELEENPVKKVHDVMESSIRSSMASSSRDQEHDEDDW